MKIIGITSTAILSLLLGICCSCLCAGAGREARPSRTATEQTRASQARTAARSAATTTCSATAAGPEQQQQRAQQQQQNQNKQQQHAQQQRVHEQPQHTQEQQRVEQSAWQQHSSQRWDSDHRTWQQRGGYHGYRIPDDRFQGYFGPQHGFRIYGLPFLVVGGYPRFQYEGYWFSVVDPWPNYWANDWYDNDDVYVSYVDNGYYLYNAGIPTSELRSTSRGNYVPDAASGEAASFYEHIRRSNTCLELY